MKLSSIFVLRMALGTVGTRLLNVFSEFNLFLVFLILSRVIIQLRNPCRVICLVFPSLHAKAQLAQKKSCYHVNV